MSEPDVPPLRVLLGRPAFDAHDEGAQLLARALRDAGFEVIVSGSGQLPAALAHTAIQEDVDVIGLSVRPGAHEQLFAALLAALSAEDAEDIGVFGGGPIPEAEARRLEDAGVLRFFGAGTPTEEVVDLLRAEAARRRRSS